jgi:hypothetical protein
MTLSGKVGKSDWSVSAEAHPTTGGFDCLIRVSHSGPDGAFEREFKHCKTFPTEREALLDGLREGIVWIELKMSKAFDL